MKEIKDIVSAYEEAVKQAKKTALATVVSVEGSSYRRPGARMLVTEDGQITGAISGGCLEGDALRKAQLAIQQEQNKLVVYDTTDEDDLKFGVQLGCNGIVSILFEPIHAGQPNPIDLLRKAVAGRRESLLVTVSGNGKDGKHPGTCAYLSAQETQWLVTDDKLQAEAEKVFSEKTSLVKELPESTALFHFVAPAVQLVIAGAGNDGQPLVEMASLLGWEILVFDGRPSHASAMRFPKADKVVVAKPGEVLSHLDLDSKTAFMLMTHNFNYDLALLEALLPTACPYIGILGPKKKTERMLQELSGKGIAASKENRLAIHGPAGLDIGAEGANEIALSILAEIKAVFSGRTGTSLKFRQATIYERA